MGLHPSIRSLLAANAGFTTGNVTSLPKRPLSFPTPSSHLLPPLELNSSGAHSGAKQIPLFQQGFLFCFSSPSCFGTRRHLPPPLPAPRANPGTLPPWLAEQVAALTDTCADCWVAQDRGAGAGARGLINIKSFMTVLSSP